MQGGRTSSGHLEELGCSLTQQAGASATWGWVRGQAKSEDREAGDPPPHWEPHLLRNCNSDPSGIPATLLFPAHCPLLHAGELWGCPPLAQHLSGPYLAQGQLPRGLRHTHQLPDPSCEPGNSDTSCCSSTMSQGPRPCLGSCFLPDTSSSPAPAAQGPAAADPHAPSIMGLPLGLDALGSPSMQSCVQQPPTLCPLFAGCPVLPHASPSCRSPCSAAGGQ